MKQVTFTRHIGEIWVSIDFRLLTVENKTVWLMDAGGGCWVQIPAAILTNKKCIPSYQVWYSGISESSTEGEIICHFGGRVSTEDVIAFWDWFDLMNYENESTEITELAQ
jgi:hypothetical protein